MDASDVPVAVISDTEMTVLTEEMLTDLGVSFDELAACAAEEDFPSEQARLVWFAIAPLGRTTWSP